MQHDVAIIGGGPAGCAAAFALRSRRHSVIVISAQAQTKKPTETAVPALARLLRSFGAAEALNSCEPCHGIVSAWGAAAPVLRPGITNPYGHAWFIHRARFDACLQQLALAQGVEWATAEAQQLASDQAGISISTTGDPVRARWAIIATGSPASAARLTEQKANRFDSMIAFWTRLSTRFDERLLRVEPADAGWWYLCPADGPGAIACFVTDPTTARKLRPNEPESWNESFRATDLHRSLENTAPAVSVNVFLTGFATLPHAHGPRWIAVGDAAAKLDPLGSSGVATALDSGQRAANAIAEALQGNNAALESYGRWTAGLVAEFARQRRHQYAREAASRPAGFWPRRLPVAA